MILLALTTAIAGAFFGASLFVSLVDHPARVACGASGLHWIRTALGGLALTLFVFRLVVHCAHWEP